MKNTLCLRLAFVFIFSFLLNSVSKGQPTTWAQPGAHWYYTIGDSVPIGYYGYYELWEDGDTLFSNGITCDILRTHEKAVQFWNGGSIYENYGPSIYTYMSNDTVYCYYQNQFHVLFVNNIQPGQNWITGPDIYNFCPGDTIILDSVMTININGVMMNRYVPIVPSWTWPFYGPGIYFHSPIYERFGSTGFFLPVPMCVTDISFGPIRCYSDSSGFNYTTNAAPSCDFITSVDNDVPDPNYLTITPSASSEAITISMEPWMWLPGDIYEIISIDGKIILQYKPFENFSRLDISQFANGMYWIKIKNRPQMKPVSFIKL